eukprot:TRINITY_DN1114_c0_g1_i3.p2 TRINITY_DN1114_c0_g1~~TRINITY_DN1114_c0_g1_i3.p2  ORF type:complete len:197 (-),score=-18.28 TRINITY_DN1114_c0_g1_i3:218-808(-)
MLIRYSMFYKQYNLIQLEPCRSCIVFQIFQKIVITQCEIAKLCQILNYLQILVSVRSYILMLHKVKINIKLQGGVIYEYTKKQIFRQLPNPNPSQVYELNRLNFFFQTIFYVSFFLNFIIQVQVLYVCQKLLLVLYFCASFYFSVIFTQQFFRLHNNYQRTTIYYFGFNYYDQIYTFLLAKPQQAKYKDGGLEGKI